MITVVIVIAVVVAVVLGLIFLLGKGGGLPSRFPPGTRAFEAELTMGPLLARLGELRQELQTASDPAQQQKLERKIKFLRDQVEENQRIMSARDLSPGRGYIGFQPPPED